MSDGPDLRHPGSLTASRLALPGTTNVRDLAGYPARDGLMIGAHRLLRGEVLAEPGGSEIQGVWDGDASAPFESLGLRTVIDLRSEREASRTPSAWGRATGAEVTALPIVEGGEGTDTNYVHDLLTGVRAGFDVDDMTRFYRDTLDRRATTFAEAVNILADPGRLPALVHCAAGKDRTGLLIAIVLEVVGTPREIVVEDYALTGVLRPNRVAAYASMFADAGVATDAVRVLFETPAASMVGALAHLDDTYGGAAEYLVTAGGLPRPALADLRSSLLVP